MKMLDVSYVIIGIIMRTLWYAELAVFGMTLSLLTQIILGTL